MERRRWERGLAVLLAAVLAGLSAAVSFPVGRFPAWGFGLVFANSGQAGHPYIRGRVEGEAEESWFLCLDQGASAHSDYDYSRVDADVDYGNGSQWEKELFWAYILAFGSCDGDQSMARYAGQITKDQARDVAWRGDVPEEVTEKLRSFMELREVPDGCKNADDIYQAVSSYGTPETALGVSRLLSGPNTISEEKLYEIAGLDSAASFRRYCQLRVVSPEQGKWTNPSTGTEFTARIIQEDNGDFRVGYGMADGTAPAAGETAGAPPIVVRVDYDPAVWSIRNISGRIEYFQCRIPGAQRLARVKGQEQVTPVAFYLTTSSGSSVRPPVTPDGSGGGDRSYRIYRHEETFESHYLVDLTKRDYETGNPLQGSVWQCLEAFPDQVRLGDDEEDGGLRRENMREEPVVWSDWLVFEEDMVTDETGAISHEDQRYYDFSQQYCNGHPLPPEPDDDDDGESEDLWAEWEAAVASCERREAAAIPGTFHHWLCGSESEPSEAEAFERSGCRANRDAAYENFIGLRYSYTFRETQPRDGYLLHGSGHGEEVPVEIITTASCEAGQEAEWTACSNGDIVVSGHVNNLLFDGRRERGESREGTDSQEKAETQNHYLREVYDLTWWQKAGNLLRSWVGLPEKEPDGSEALQTVVTIQAEPVDRMEEGSGPETGTASNALLSRAASSAVLSVDAERTDTAVSLATASDTAEEPEEVWEDEIFLVNDLDGSGGLATSSDAQEIGIPPYQLDAAAAASRMDPQEEEDSGAVRMQLEEGAASWNIAPILDTQPAIGTGVSGTAVSRTRTAAAGSQAAARRFDGSLHSWIVYDIRVPGEIHINKRDRELLAGESDRYGSEGDTQGDATLEGAVYGLFAAAPIYHPDTRRGDDGSVLGGTGIVFDANDLVAVAVTDHKGDASFTTITQVPHSTYDYSKREIVVSGKAYPGNLYDTDGYRKEYEEEETGRLYEDHLEHNGDYWIGRPLLLGSYYVKELSRSEGYELSVTGREGEITNVTEETREQYGGTEDAWSQSVGTAWIREPLQYAATFPERNETYGNRENLLYFEVGSHETVHGYDVVIDGIPAGAEIYWDNTELTPVTVQVPVNGRWEPAKEEPLYETADSAALLKRDKNGMPIPDEEAKPTIPVPYVDYAEPARLLEDGGTAEPADQVRCQAKWEDTEENFYYLKWELEQMLRQLGAETPRDEKGYSSAARPVFDEPDSGGCGAPEVTVRVAGVTSNGSLLQGILDYFAGNRIYTYGSLQAVQAEGDDCLVKLAVRMTPEDRTLYETDDSGELKAVYVYKPNQATGRLVLRRYTGQAVSAAPAAAGSRRYFVQLVPDFTIGADGKPVDRMDFENSDDRYLHYVPGEILYDYWTQDPDGQWVGHSPVARMQYVYDLEERVVEESRIHPSKVPVVASREEVSDPIGSTYAVYQASSGQYRLHVGAGDRDLSGSAVSSFTMVLEDGRRTVTAEDMEKLGAGNVWEIQEGDRLLLSEYLIRVQGAGVGVSVSDGFDTEMTYILSQDLVYQGGYDLAEDGGTQEHPLLPEERVIKQRIKVTKNVEDGPHLAHFRFKTYLKSNLERLYRDRDGTVVWQDQRPGGQDRTAQEQLEANRAYPGLANPIYTKTASDDGREYERILETLSGQGEEAPSYHYEKFFDAIDVANQDQWDEQTPYFTSGRPLGNVWNRTQDAIENTAVSDAVRQFAIDWYLDEEVEKLVLPFGGGGAFGELGADGAAAWEDDSRTDAKPTYEASAGSTAYSDQLYDQALRAAVLRAEDYLKPFFAYDLDAIYGIAWDPEAGGGDDGDDTTLSADQLSPDGGPEHAGYYFGISEYLPYGVYVVVEQQPKFRGLGDLQNRHYWKDQPREVVVPSVYGGYEGSQQVPEIWSSYYEEDGAYAARLVPWSMTAPRDQEAEKTDLAPHPDGSSSGKGYGYGKFFDRRFRAFVRLEKLDAETHEALLHDDAIFQIYRGKREESPDGDGTPLFYETDTMISGTREFLEAMGAADIRPMARGRSWLDWLTGAEYGPGNRYTGMVPAGTPVCQESDQILFSGDSGDGEVIWRALSTVYSGNMPAAGDKTGTILEQRQQNAGYLETPEPLEAGVYVLCEKKAPAGYARSRPIALEVYSDRAAYYQSGGNGERTAAALYERQEQPRGWDEQEREPSVLRQEGEGRAPDKSGEAAKTDNSANSADNANSANTSNTANTTQDALTARMYVENTPITLRIEKQKESSQTEANTTPDKTVTYKVSGRIDGRLAEIGNRPDLVYAYEHGEYLGYAWKRGTLEYLAARKAAGEQVELVYEGTVFAGYGYVTRQLATADDADPYVAGAMLTLFDALELTPSGDTQDHAYEGLVVERDLSGRVTRMYVQEGWAGSRTELVLETAEATEQAAGLWSAVTVQRPDTDILFYDLSGLDVTVQEYADGQMIRYGYDLEHRKIPLAQMESDRQNYAKTDRELSVYAFRDGTPYLEITGGDFTEISYSPVDKVLTVGEQARVYHLDADGNRDALVDPYTGMAYVTEADGQGGERILVWAVRVRLDQDGTQIACDKITTSRIAAVGENQRSDDGGGSGYLTGSWRSEQGEESHRETSLETNGAGQNQNGSILADDNNGTFPKEMEPVYDRHGLVQYYQQSQETYDKSTDLYDEAGTFLRQQDSDNLGAYNQAAYQICPEEELYDGDLYAEGQEREPLFHRLGESYPLENTWISSDRSPNDPFDSGLTDGQADILKRVPAGHYILEELRPPQGYGKAMPTGVTVKETGAVQQIRMTDHTTKVEISKIDAGGFGSCGLVKGATLALYEAEPVAADDLDAHPNGYELVRTGTEPAAWLSTEATASEPVWETGVWETGNQPIYAEGIPAGWYLLAEEEVPSGFVSRPPLELEIRNTPEIQTLFLENDHTRVEVEKYALDGTERVALPGAGFTLYPAQTDETGQALWEDGKPLYDGSAAIAQWMTADIEKYRGFLTAFENMYRDYGTTPGTRVTWEWEGDPYQAEYRSCQQIDASISGGPASIWPTAARMEFETNEGKWIRIAISGEKDGSLGRDFTFSYQLEYEPLPQINPYAHQYLTLEGRHCLEYLPVGGQYVLVETAVPDGYAEAEPRLIRVLDTAEIQLYEIENQEGALIISKTGTGGAGELPGAHLALYRPDETGGLQMTEEYQITDWITGEDGVYTQEDRERGRIPEGYQEGDLRPHIIRRLPDGVYWLVELESPDYYMRSAPIRIIYRQKDPIQAVQMINEPATGSMEVKKTDGAGRLLSEAVFELSAYRSGDRRTPVLTRMLSTTGGIVREQGLPVGEPDETGRIIPYQYRLEELVPPDGYAVSTQVLTWEFSPDNQGVSYDIGQEVVFQAAVQDQKTRIVISKRAFSSLQEEGTEGIFVEGAHLALHEICGRDEDGTLIWKEEPLERWVTTQEEPEHVVEGLIAGRSYLLREEQAPYGYCLMDPMVLTVSADGRKLTEVSNRLDLVTIHWLPEAEQSTYAADPAADPAAAPAADPAADPVAAPAADPAPDPVPDGIDGYGILAVTVRGRYAGKTTYTVEAEDGSVKAAWAVPVAGRAEETAGQPAAGTGTGAAPLEHLLQKTDGLEDGRPYRIVERTHYSDGTEVITGSMVRVLRFDSQGLCRIPVRQLTEVELAVEYADGTLIQGFTPWEYGQEMTIYNPAAPENPGIWMRNQGEPSDGQAGALDPRRAVINTISYTNPSRQTADLTITVELDGQTEILDTGGGTETDEGTLVFEIPAVRSLESGTVSFSIKVSAEGAGAASKVTATLEGGGISRTTVREVPVLQPGMLTVFCQATGNRQSTEAGPGGSPALDLVREYPFRIRLFDKNGEELRGRYSWNSRHASGTLRSGDTVLLEENGAMTIDPAPYQEIHYEVTPLEPLPGWEEPMARTGRVPAGSGACAWFLIKDEDQTQRQIFRKGEAYQIRETTSYTDGSRIESSRFGFSLDGNGSVSQITAYDRKTDVLLAKQDLTDGSGLEGCQMGLFDQDGQEIDSWISGREPHRLTGVLEPDVEYTLREIMPAEGYTCAPELAFRTGETGAAELVVMEDFPTKIRIEKVIAGTDEPLAGAVFVILDSEGKEWFRWTSGEEPIEITGILAAGAAYTLRELRPPKGYQRMEDMEFTVPLGPETVTLRCENQPAPGKPGQPEEPEPETPVPFRIGTITAVYRPQQFRAGSWIFFGPDGSIGIPMLLPGTGDRRVDACWYLAGFLLPLAGIWRLTRRKALPKKRKRFPKG